MTALNDDSKNIEDEIDFRFSCNNGRVYEICISSIKYREGSLFFKELPNIIERIAELQKLYYLGIFDCKGLSSILQNKLFTQKGGFQNLTILQLDYSLERTPKGFQHLKKLQYYNGKKVNNLESLH